MENWNRNGWCATLRQSRYGEYCSFTILPIDDQVYSAEWLADAEISYRWNRYTFAVGAENLFDRSPTATSYRNVNGALTAQINNGVSTYPINTPFGMNGRYVYTRVSYTF